MNHLIKRIYTLFIAFILAAVTSCTYTFPEPEQLVPGTADFTKFVAVGNSLTAGFMNGALYDDGQETSFPSIIATQMKLNGGGEFNQPDINATDGIILSFLPAEFGRLILKGELTATGVINPVPTPIGPGDPFTPFGGDRSALNNFGVPGMRIIHAEIPGYGDPIAGNPYYWRFASSGTSSVIGDATAANGSFFTFWLGNNDVLGYALAGATGLVEGTTGIDMTPVDLFTGAYNSAIAKMVAGGASGIIANIPNVQDIAHFTTIGWDRIGFDPDDPVSQPTIDALNAGFAGLNSVLDALKDPQFGLDPDNLDARKVAYALGSNPILMQDNKLTDLGPFYDILAMLGAISPEQRAGLEPYRQSRPMTSSDLVTLTAGSVLGTLLDPPGNDPRFVIGVSIPLGEQYTLDLADQEAIANRTADFNAAIKAVADGSGGNIAFLDMNSIFADLVQSGVSINGSGMDASISPPFGAFSLDGVHPNERGAAYIASLFISKINEAFGSNIPNVNPNNYPGNELPQPNN